MTSDVSPDTDPGYDRSFLPPAVFEFVVLGDTHFILNPESYAVEFASVRTWPMRVERALQRVASLDTEFVIHLGDLAEENPARPDYLASRQEARKQLERNGIAPFFVAGNMDIGDKPDATMWTDWVSPETLRVFHELFGRSWYSFDRHGIHFIVLNSQIMNGRLPEAEEQTAWLAADLAAHDGQRIFMFMHMPPFFVEEQEPDAGFYNSLNEPARSWITGLLRKRRVELLFTGHTHFRMFNRVGDTRFFVCPSTTTSRAGFYEAFSVAPPVEQGRNDPPKLGFYLVRVYDDGARVHLVRTNGETGPAEAGVGRRRLLTRISQDLPHSPVGVFLRTPLAFQSAGALAWPSVLRQRVRDDHPFLSCIELGARHVRVPVSDLDDDLQRRRLELLRQEGVGVTAVWVWSVRLNLLEAVGKHADRIDTVELQTPGTLWPEAGCLRQLAQCGQAASKPVVLTPMLSREAVGGKYHPRTRSGYRAEELPELDRRLSELDIRLDRVLCHIDAMASPWDAVRAFGGHLPLSCVAGLDYVVGLPGTDDRLHAMRVAEAVFAAAQQRGCRLFLDPFVDLDRTNDASHGLLDRLSNPRPAYFAAQYLNTILFSEPTDRTPCEVYDAGPARILGLEGGGSRRWLILPQDGPLDPACLDGLACTGETCVFDLVNGTALHGIPDADALKHALAGAGTPWIVMCG